MREADNRIERLEREMRRLRGWILVLGITLVAAFALGATQGTSDELTLRKLIIVDGNGETRITAGAQPSGGASLIHYDGEGKARIIAATLPNGKTSVQHHDG